jgi:hypothetical protein
MVSPDNSRSETNDGGESSARQRAIEAYEGTRDRAVETLNELPLIALAGGIAAGALIAALLPRTATETRAVRPTARRLKKGAAAATKTAREASKERFNELGFTRQEGEETLNRFLQGLKETARASADAALEAARNKS